MKTIFLFIAKDIYGLDLLRGDYIKYLTSKYRIIAFVKKATLDKNQAVFYQSPNLIYQNWEVQSPIFWDRMKVVRSLMIRQFDYLVPQKYKKQKAWRTGGWKQRLAILISAAFSFLFTVDFWFFVERLFLPKKSIYAFQKYRQNYKPVLVLTATPGISNIDAEALALAKKLKIACVAIDASWDNLTTKVRSFRRPDYFVVWNNVIKNELLKLYKHSEDKICVSGMVRFDAYFKTHKNFTTREEFLRQKKLNPQHKTLFFSTTSPGVYPYHKEILKLLFEARRQNKFFVYPNILVRLHYKDSIDNYREFLKEPDLYIEEFKPLSLEQDLLNLKASFLYTDVNINYTSTLSIDAAVFDRPVINIAWPDEPRIKHYTYNHYRPIIDSGAVRLAKNEGKLLQFVNMYLQNPAIDRERRSALAKIYVIARDGFSYKRHLDFLEKIIKN